MNDGYPTIEYFDLFKAEVEGWVQRFSLGDWRLAITQRADLGESDANTFVFELSKIAEIAIGAEWEIVPDDYTITRTAFHEALELLMTDIEEIGNRAHPCPVDLRKAVHAAIRRLENAFFDGYWKARQTQAKPGRVRPDSKRTGGKH